MIFKKRKHAVASLVAAAAIATITACVTPHKPPTVSPLPEPTIIAHVGPAYLYPDAAISPGLVATTDFTELTSKGACGTYSQCHRQTTGQMKTEVRNEYPSCPSAQGQSEIDHIVPLALGGADDVKNLWCQPADNQWNGMQYGFHVKDALETYLVNQMKAGKMSPSDAQLCIRADWVACYQKYLGTPSLGGASSDPDNQ